MWPQIIHATRGDNVNVGSTAPVLALGDYGSHCSNRHSPERTHVIYIGIGLGSCVGAYTSVSL